MWHVKIGYIHISHGNQLESVTLDETLGWRQLLVLVSCTVVFFYMKNNSKQQTIPPPTTYYVFSLGITFSLDELKHQQERKKCLSLLCRLLQLWVWLD